jgi:polysaccharide pyruvyl transferase WcaK-like protein
LDYADRFLELIKTLGTQDFHYIFMPNATREGSDKSHNNDLLTLTRMREAYEITQAQSPVGAGIEWVDYDINTASVRRIISQADVLVTSRYHAMISGLSLGVPTVVIGWGHKYKETMAYFNLGEYSFDFGGESMDLPAIILKILGDAKGVREKINVNLPEVKRLAQKQFDYLKRVLL